MARPAVGTSTTTGDGGMTAEEREHSKLLVYQAPPSRYGMNPDDLEKPDAIEVVVGQGAKPAAAECCSARRSPSARPKRAACLKVSISARPAAIRTGQILMTWKSKSRAS